MLSNGKAVPDQELTEVAVDTRSVGVEARRAVCEEDGVARDGESSSVAAGASVAVDTLAVAFVKRVCATVLRDPRIATGGRRGIRPPSLPIWS